MDEITHLHWLQALMDDFLDEMDHFHWLEHYWMKLLVLVAYNING
jgi:hypothetical protein